MAVSRMSEPLFLGDPDEGQVFEKQPEPPVQLSPRSARKQRRKEAKKLINQISKDVVITNEFFNSLRREIHNSGVDVHNADEVLTFTENKRIEFCRIYHDLDKNDSTARFNLANMIGFLRRMQERSEEFLEVVARPPPPLN